MPRTYNSLFVLRIEVSFAIIILNQLQCHRLSAQKVNFLVHVLPLRHLTGVVGVGAHSRLGAYQLTYSTFRWALKRINPIYKGLTSWSIFQSVIWRRFPKKLLINTWAGLSIVIQFISYSARTLIFPVRLVTNVITSMLILLTRILGCVRK